MTTLPELKTPTAVAPGFDTERGFALLQKMATDLARSGLVPKQFQGTDPQSVANCAIAISISTALGLHPLTVTQHLQPIQGRIAWSAEFLTARINASGQYSPIRYLWEKDDKPKTIEYSVWQWNDQQRRNVSIKKSKQITDQRCTAYATHLATGTELHGATVSIEMAVREGWYDRPGSKWKTMPRVMLQKRAVSFWQRENCPELTMALPSADEAMDIVESEAAAIEGDIIESSVADDVDIDMSRETIAAPEPAPAPKSDAAPVPAPKRGRPAKKNAVEDKPIPGFDDTPNPPPIESSEEFGF